MNLCMFRGPVDIHCLKHFYLGAMSASLSRQSFLNLSFLTMWLVENLISAVLGTCYFLH